MYHTTNTPSRENSQSPMTIPQEITKITKDELQEMEAKLEAKMDGLK
jgi:hypothetical protein